ncbi:hypothetical protein NQ318_021725 [Aromia moschata]|uniref:Uncharacterized protein n=1 Tax=Aromia moschata TaxID=1265417 RepID=A0AAV8XXV4_9CUCU|nr:hypothetical protein NQ318_021725 [Aromia moschata]
MKKRPYKMQAVQELLEDDPDRRSMDVASTCMTCGGYRLLPCQICKGSKKICAQKSFYYRICGSEMCEL